MRLKLTLLALFTAIVSFACAGTQTARQEPQMEMARQAPSVKMQLPPGQSYKPITIQRTDLVLGGMCKAKLTFDPKTGGLIDVATEDPCWVKDVDLLVNGKKILDISGTLTFGGTHLGCYWLDNKTKCIGH